MRDAIIAMCLEAIQRNGHPQATRETLRRDPAHAAAALALLRDCRPLPVIRDLIAELEAATRRPD